MTESKHFGRPLGIGILVALAGLFASPAGAHGPCGCTSPDSGIPGDTLRLEHLSAVEVVWNPPLDSLRIDAPGMIDGDYVEGSLSPVLFESRKRRRGVEVEVPDVNPGRYLMVVYDGSEGGNHYTWDYVRVLDDGDDQKTLLPVLVGCLAVLASVGLVAQWRKRLGGN